MTSMTFPILKPFNVVLQVSYALIYNESAFKNKSTVNINYLNTKYTGSSEFIYCCSIYCNSTFTYWIFWIYPFEVQNLTIWEFIIYLLKVQNLPIQRS
jgi:hypothetical protein